LKFSPLCLSCKKYRGLREQIPRCKKHEAGIPRPIIFEAAPCASFTEKTIGESTINIIQKNKLGKMELKERLIELRAAGYSFEAIAKEIGVSKATLISWSKDLAIDIQNARSLRIDELSQRFVVAKEKRIEAFGKCLNEILKALDKRDFSNLETDKLLMLALKYGEMLRAEFEPLTLAKKTESPRIYLLKEELDTWQV